ncbi:putative F-actin-capping protein subunit beta [Platanthera zijinensis]|uniref:F-actin-capping protein subunit beta n=1 Tax=Platanthera zijinensis TaxID=2320716 RepID=A0AAP0AZ05_9ASPA
MEAAMDLMRRISPNQSETALSALLALLPHHSSELLSQVDQPLQVLMDGECAKEFILCEYNRDADSYRSPWSNKYFPPLEDGSLPSAEMRKLEIEANAIFSVYRDQYYEGGVSSVYVWEDDRQGFVSCFLIKKDGSKTGDGRRGYLHEGSWEAIHVIEVGPEEDGKAHYCLTSTVMLSLTTEEKPSGTFNLSGSIRRQDRSSNVKVNHMIMLVGGEERPLCDMFKSFEKDELKDRNRVFEIPFPTTETMAMSLSSPPMILSYVLVLAILHWQPPRASRKPPDCGT